MAITRNEDMPGAFGGPAVVPQHDGEWSEARRTAMDRYARIAERVAANRGAEEMFRKRDVRDLVEKAGRKFEDTGKARDFAMAEIARKFGKIPAAAKGDLEDLVYRALESGSFKE